MTKPKTLVLDNDEDPVETLKEKVAQFKIKCADYFNNYKIDRENWVSHAYHWLDGRVKRAYTHYYEQGGSHLDWYSFTDMLDDLVAGTDDTEY